MVRVSLCMSHPQAKFPTRRPSGYPILRRMKLCNRRHSSDTIAPELSYLMAFSRVDVDEAVHVSDDEFLDIVLGAGLPLGSETRVREDY